MGAPTAPHKYAQRAKGQRKIMATYPLPHFGTLDELVGYRDDLVAEIAKEEAIGAASNGYWLRAKRAHLERANAEIRRQRGRAHDARRHERRARQLAEELRLADKFSVEDTRDPFELLAALTVLLRIAKREGRFQPQDEEMALVDLATSTAARKLEDRRGMKWPK